MRKTKLTEPTPIS